MVLVRQGDVYFLGLTVINKKQYELMGSVRVVVTI